ncbi:MAG: hypothetical protein H7Z40_15050 [Phycisphaerae bacterium]|nr:hypothetical protein [Gemmatimonadaceae bacterium]
MNAPRVVLVGILCAASSAAAQNAQDMAVRYAIPASPAFKLVSVNETAILRPASFQQLTTALSNFTDKKQAFQLPREWGIEVAPVFMAKGRHLSASDYQQHPTLYRFRISAAVKRSESNGVNDVALGFRFSPVDKSDPRSNPDYVSGITALLTRVNQICVARVTGPDGSRNPELRPNATVGPVGAVCDNDPAIVTLNKQIKAFKDAWADSSWNKSQVQFAFAAHAHASDSLGRDPEFASAVGWFSAAKSIGTWGQFTGGLNVTAKRDTLDRQNRTTATGGVGFYTGSSKYKAFFESEIARDDTVTVGSAKLGAEFFLTEQFWGHLTVGWQSTGTDDKGRLVTRLTLSTNFPLKVTP